MDLAADLAAVSVRSLADVRGAVEALRGVSFTVPKGCTYGVIGRNGSGKSTLLKCVAGITRPTPRHPGRSLA